MSSENLDATIEDEENDLNQETHNDDDSRRVRSTPQGESGVQSSTTEQPDE